jgi:hypothetical protein
MKTLHRVVKAISEADCIIPDVGVVIGERVCNPAGTL